MKHTKQLAAIAAAVFMAGSYGYADVITMVNSNASFGQSWATASSWSNNQAAQAGHDYVVSGASFTLRSPVYAPGQTLRVFPGDSLTIDGAQFNLSSSENVTNGQSATVQVDDLRLVNGGVIVNSIGGSTAGLAGKLTVNDGDTVYIRTAGVSGNFRHIVLDAQVVGGATIHLLQGGTISVTNSTNEFDGTWRVGGSATVLGAAVSSTANTVTTLKAAAGLGEAANLQIDAFGHFDPDYDWSTSGTLTINDDALVTLDQNLTVGGLSILGNQFSAGTYSFSDLNSAYDSLFVDGGTGSITVVPEPSAAGMAALGGLLLIRRR